MWDAVTGALKKNNIDSSKLLHFTYYHSRVLNIGELLFLLIFLFGCWFKKKISLFCLFIFLGN